MAGEIRLTRLEVAAIPSTKRNDPQQFATALLQRYLQVYYGPRIYAEQKIDQAMQKDKKR